MPRYQPTDIDLLKDEKAIVQSDPAFLITGGFLHIKTKSGELLHLKLNNVQKFVLEKINKLREQKKLIRLWILKFRQGGISTLIEALIYALTSQQENRNSLIMADEEDKSNYLFEMSKLYQEKLEETDPHLINPLKKSNAKQLEFEQLHSKIIIETARNVDAARAFTYQYCHLSEVARFPDLKGVLGALMQSVPKYWDTFVIGETTANGMDEFYKEWQKAKKGKTDWLPLFIPWFWMDEYTLSLENGQMYPIDEINFSSDYSSYSFELDEQKIKEEFGLSDEQLNWRRWCIVNNCGGDLNLFRQEYPSTDDEAFIMSGSMFFDKGGMEKQVPMIPIARGDIFYEGMEYIFRELPTGRIEVYEYPKFGEQYIIASDASEAVGLDEAAALVLNKRLNTTAAIAHGNYSPEELAEIGISLGNWYNQGMIAPENKNYGYMVCQLTHKKYGNIYKKIITRKGEKEHTEELGFNTNSVTRPQMLAELNEEIKNSSTQLNAKALIEECRTFITKRDDKGKVTKVEAQDGFQDGLVICRCIAGMVRNQYPYLKQKKEFKPQAGKVY